MNDDTVEAGKAACECAPLALKVAENESWPWGESFGLVFCPQHRLWVGFYRVPLEQS